MGAPVDNQEEYYKYDDYVYQYISLNQTDYSGDNDSEYDDFYIYDDYDTESSIDPWRSCHDCGTGYAVYDR